MDESAQQNAAPKESGDTHDLAAAIEKQRREYSGPAGPEAKTDAQKKLDALLAKLVTPKRLKRALIMPSEFLYAKTKWDGWLLGDEEKAELEEIADGSIEIMKELIGIDPRWFFGISAFLSISLIYGTRGLAYKGWKEENALKATQTS